MGGVRWHGEARHSPTQAQASILGRTRATRSIQPNFRRRIGGRNNRKPRTVHVITCRRTQRRGARRVQGDVRPRLRSTTDCEDFPLGHCEVSRSTYRKSSSAIVSDRETGNEREIQNGNDLAAKGAFPAWIRGGVRLHAIVGAGAVGGRSTGGHRDRRRARCGNRDTRDATAARAAHSPSDATVAISDGTRAAPVNLRPPRRRRHRSSGPSALKRLIARFDELRNCICPQRTTQ